MKIRCDRKALMETVGLAAGITASRGTRPILQHVLITAEKDELSLHATDLELSISCRHKPIELSGEGSVALPASTLLEVLRESGGQTVDLSTDGTVALLRSSHGQFRISGEHPEDFPDIPSAKPEGDFLEIGAGEFKSLAENTQFAASRELGRYAINGILVEVQGKSIRFVSTDGRRLALAESELPAEAKTEVSQILPLKGVLHFLKAIGPEDETVGLNLEGRCTLLRCGSSVIAATSLEAKFPPYENVVPKAGSGQTLRIPGDPFFSCVRQAAIMAGEDSPCIVLTFDEGSLVFESAVEGRGDARTEMAVDYTGTKLSLSLNPDFLTDFSKVTLPEELPFELWDSDSACVFRVTDRFLYVVMPINS